MSIASHFKNIEIYKTFHHAFVFEQRKNSLTSCRFCNNYKNMTYNITRMTKHLKICKNFLNDSSNFESDIVAKVMKKKLKKKHEKKNEINKSFDKKQLTQTTFAFSSMTKNTTKRINILIARAIFENDKTLITFEKSIMKKFLKTLNSIYESSFKKIIFNILLKKMFEKKNKIVIEILHNNNYINYIIDDVFNINQKRIVNFIAQTSQYDNFHLSTKNMFFFFHIVEFLTFRIFNKMMLWCDDKSHNVNFFCTNETVVMRRMWKYLQNQSTWKHVFFLICDNHDIQLLIKNIVTKLFWFVNFFKRIQAIIFYYNKNDKCVILFREHQRRFYKNKIFVMLLSIITRWDNQINELQIEE